MRAPTHACANHPEVPAVARCTKCRTPCCDPCSTFLINDVVWCEPCGAEEIDSGKGRPGLALVASVALLLVWAALMAVQLLFSNRIFLITLAGILFPFGVGWRIAYPPTAGDKPTIVDRRVRRVPLPASARA